MAAQLRLLKAIEIFPRFALVFLEVLIILLPQLLREEWLVAITSFFFFFLKFRLAVVFTLSENTVAITQ